MSYFATSLFATTLIIVAKAASSASGFDFTSLLPLLGVLIGGFVSAATSFFLNSRSNKQQLKRDEQAYNNQIERERIAYERALKDSRRERLRSAYKVILNAVDKYQFEMQQLNHLPSSVNISLTGVDEAVTEITLEDVGTDVTTIFFDLRGAFQRYTVELSTHGSHGEELAKHRETVFEKAKEITAAMQRHLKELE
jgi:hypothetical protein